MRDQPSGDDKRIMGEQSASTPFVSGGYPREGCGAELGCAINAVYTTP